MRWLAVLLLAGCTTTAGQPIGFRVVDLYDKLRGDDPFVGRPIRVRLFYPSLGNGKPITLHEYLAEWPMSGVDEAAWREEIARETEGAGRMDTSVRAHLDASPDRARHPLVMLALDAPIDQIARIGEDLASHGYVVAALPRGVDAADVRFANTALRGLADVDEHRIAVVGTGGVAFDGSVRRLRRSLSATFSRASSPASRARDR